MHVLPAAASDSDCEVWTSGKGLMRAELPLLRVTTIVRVVLVFSAGLTKAFNPEAGSPICTCLLGWPVLWHRLCTSLHA